jgi:hypothetical protein
LLSSEFEGNSTNKLSTWNEAVDDLGKGEQRNWTCVNPATEYDQRSLAFGPSLPHRIGDTPAKIIQPSYFHSADSHEKSNIILFPVCCIIPVTIVGDGRVGDGRTRADIGAQQTEDGAAQSAENGSLVEAVDDEDGRLDHHDEIADGQVENQDVAGRFQLFGPI